MLPLESEPVICGSKNIHIKCFHELANSFIEEPISNGRVVIPSFFQRQTCIFWVLLYVNLTSLEGTPSHFGVESKISKTRMFGKPAIFITHQMLEVIPHRYSTLSWSQKITVTSGKQCREGTGDVSFGDKLVYWSVPTRRPWNYIVWMQFLSLIDVVLHIVDSIEDIS